MKTQFEPDFAKRLQAIRQQLPESLQHALVLDLIALSLAEDLYPDGLGKMDDRPSRYDLTSASIFSNHGRSEGRIFSREAGIIAGLPIAQAVFALVEGQVDFQHAVKDGEAVAEGQNVARVHGPASGLFAAERTALNFLGRMSGIASLTRKYVAAVAHTGAIILDTRKTAPGHRLLDKYAVHMGGGENHRLGLYDMVLIKNNHIDGAGGIESAVERVREEHAHQFPIEVEVRTLDELHIALTLQPERIMLDNMDLETMRRAVKINNHRVPLEASGNVSLDTVAEIAETGVDYISIGSLTHSAPVFDVSMHVDQPDVNMDQT